MLVRPTSRPDHLQQQGGGSALALNVLGRLKHDAREMKEAGDLYTRALALSGNDSAIFQVRRLMREWNGMVGLGVSMQGAPPPPFLFLLSSLV